jgi:CHAT domain-containing protein/uncharacterized protein HemY
LKKAFASAFPIFLCLPIAGQAPDAGIETLQKQLAECRARQDRRCEGQALKAIGNAYYVQSKYAESIDYQNQALAAAQATNDKDLESRALVNLANAFRDQGDPAKALPFYERSLAIAKTLPARQVEAICRNGLGVAVMKLRRYAEAETKLKATLDLARALGDRGLEMNALAFLGETYEAMKAPARALEYYELLLPLTRGRPNRGRELVALLAVASTAVDSRRYPQAIQYAAQSLDLSRTLNEREGVFASLQIRGVAQTGLGDHHNALETYQLLLEYSREVKDWRHEADGLNFMGQLDISAGDFLKAIDAFRQALAIARRENDAEVEASALAGLGKVHVSLNALSEARGFHEQQLAVAKKANDPSLVYSALQELGYVSMSSGEYRQALDFYRQSLALAAGAPEGAGEARALNYVASAYEALLDVPHAIEFGERALKAARDSGNQWETVLALGTLSSAYQRRKDPRCLEYLAQMEDLNREFQLGDESVILSNRGRAHLALGQPGLARTAFERSLVEARRGRDRAGEGGALEGIGAACMARQDFHCAESALEQAVAIWESERSRLAGEDRFKVSVFEHQAATCRHLQFVQVALNRVDAALETAERGRARAFVELLSRRMRNRTGDPGAEAVPSVTAADIRRIAREEQATLIEYSLLPEISEMFVWAVKPSGEIAFSRVKLPDSMEQLVAGTRNSLGVPAAARGMVVRRKQEQSSGAQLERLYQLLIGPVAAALPADPAARIIFIPQRELFFVPFAALRDETGKYLVEKHSVLVAPSIQVLDLARQQQQKAPAEAAALVVGNPVMPSVGSPPEPLPSLPGTENEAREIATLLHVRPLTGAEATKVTVTRRMPEAGLVHLATHGLLEDVGDIGVPGAVALAPSKGDNGLLTATEILDMKLRARMVVLSACDTGRGRITGDGVIGLSRSFISAGVPSVVVSLWPVSDASASALMQEFYRRLAANGRAAALREAMLATMRTYPNPSDWAAFVLVGQP